AKWEAEGRPWTREVPDVKPTAYTAKNADDSIRAYRDEVLKQVQDKSGPLVDVRSNAEYTGELLHAIGYPQEGAQRAGHIKGAHNVPWGTAVNEDGTIKSADELRKIYGEHGVSG